MYRNVLLFMRGAAMWMYMAKSYEVVEYYHMLKSPTHNGGMFSLNENLAS